MDYWAAAEMIASIAARDLQTWLCSPRRLDCGALVHSLQQALSVLSDMLARLEAGEDAEHEGESSSLGAPSVVSGAGVLSESPAIQPALGIVRHRNGSCVQIGCSRPCVIKVEDILQLREMKDCIRLSLLKTLLHQLTEATLCFSLKQGCSNQT